MKIQKYLKVYFSHTLQGTLSVWKFKVPLEMHENDTFDLFNNNCNFQVFWTSLQTRSDKIKKEKHIFSAEKYDMKHEKYKTLKTICGYSFTFT